MTEAFNVKAEVSCFKLKGEDFHFIKKMVASATVFGDLVEVDYAALGVFDGHGGKRCAEFSSKQFPGIIEKQLGRKLQHATGLLDCSAYTVLSESGHPSVGQLLLQDALIMCAPEALVASFLQVDEEFLSKDIDSGTTATVSIICGKDVVTANVGDSLVFFDCGSGVHQLSGNHRIDENSSERKRLEHAGGEISQSEVDGHACGPLRIWPGGLAMSRTIGDRHAGARVTAKPSVSQVCVGPAGARITLASDGLWDAFNNNGKTVCHRVRDLQHTKAAARLRSAAKEKRDRDDITVICCDMLPDPSIRIPPALTTRKEQELHQVWHPLEQPHMWHNHWSRRMNERNAAYPPHVAPVECGPTECITGESNTSSQEGDGDWETVPVRRSHGPFQLGKLSSEASRQVKHVQEQRIDKRRTNGKGRGQIAGRSMERSYMPSLTHGFDDCPSKPAMSLQGPTPAPKSTSTSERRTKEVDGSSRPAMRGRGNRGGRRGYGGRTASSVQCPSERRDGPSRTTQTSVAK